MMGEPTREAPADGLPQLKVERVVGRVGQAAQAQHLQPLLVQVLPAAANTRTRELAAAWSANTWLLLTIQPILWCQPMGPNTPPVGQAQHLPIPPT